MLLSSVAAVEAIKFYPALTLKDGRQFTAVAIVNYTTTGVLVRHSGGATSLGIEVLPEQVITELHLPSPSSAQPFANDPAFLALAGKVAVADKVAEADKVAVAETRATSGSGGPAANDDSNVSLEQARAAALTSTTDASLAPGGEGNLPSGFVSEAKPVVLGARSNWITFAGRVAVTLPSGETRLMGGVEVGAYPADLLAQYLVQARAKSADLAQKLRDQAALAAQEGRAADSAALVARATKTAEEYVDLIPVARYATRSDAFGNFTLRHDLRDIRLVAVGRINVAQGERTYAWIGVVPGEDSLLTEANATVVSAPATNSSHLAAR